MACPVDPAPVNERKARILVVDAAISAAEALARLRSGERFDIIFCDLMMPEMSGMELYEMLERELPEVAKRVVFLTGGAFAPKARTFLEQVKNPRVYKPFEVSALRAMVTGQLGEPDSPQEL
jgi:CheY-like chemotaxis protein